MQCIYLIYSRSPVYIFCLLIHLWGFYVHRIVRARSHTVLGMKSQHSKCKHAYVQQKSRENRNSWSSAYDDEQRAWMHVHPSVYWTGLRASRYKVQKNAPWPNSACMIIIHQHRGWKLARSDLVACYNSNNICNFHLSIGKRAVLTHLIHQGKIHLKDINFKLHNPQYLLMISVSPIVFGRHFESCDLRNLHLRCNSKCSSFGWVLQTGFFFCSVKIHIKMV